MNALDPTTVRLSPHFLLSDFLGNHSVFTRGLSNVFQDPTGVKLREGEHLCEMLLEPLLSKYGPMSISYGYISPSLSKEIVSYQNPNTPSYHRWDKGAAADVLIHSQIKRRSPIEVAHDIDTAHAYSRMITYSESPFICVATQLSEKDQPRKAFYENRYCGEKGAKPLFIKKSATEAGRRKQSESLGLTTDWRGAGYPTYHGGGIRQLHHYRASRYSVVSDFLYSTHAIRTGVANLPNLKQDYDRFIAAGSAYDALLTILDVPRLNIVQAFESRRFNKRSEYNWRERFVIDFKMPEYLEVNDAAELALKLIGKHFSAVSVDNTTDTLRVIGLDDDTAE